jgi:regulation of enolase protein 1 (concanavalin A-like superfamily)
MTDWSLTSLQLRLIRVNVRVARQARATTFRLAEAAAPNPMVCASMGPNA